MNITTQIATKIITAPNAADCSFKGSIDNCKDDDLQKTLESSVPLWSQAVVVFRVIAVLMFLKQVFAIVKHVMAGKPVDALKAAAYGAVGVFLLFDLSNTIGIVFNLKTIMQTAIDKIQKTVSNTTT